MDARRRLLALMRQMRGGEGGGGEAPCVKVPDPRSAASRVRVGVLLLLLLPRLPAARSSASMVRVGLLLLLLLLLPRPCPSLPNLPG